MEFDIAFSDKIKLGLRYASHKISQRQLTTKEKSVIQTTYGPVQGIKRFSIYGDPYYSFEGIPFAKPPLGKLRFQSPVEPDAWTQIKDCSEVGPKPVQHNLVLKRYEGSEDCLYLNVFSRNLNPLKLAPVLVWIFGGGFQVGEASRDIYSPDYFMKKDVVLISITYRLGPLGFLSLDDPETGVPGNAGLKDQVMALKWVHKNCAMFGGDPENITVFGESAGGASAHYMMLTEQTRGLFHKGIIMSGCCLAQWANIPRRNWAHRLALAMGYSGTLNDKDVLGFLQTAKPTSLVKFGEAILSKEEQTSRIPFSFGPVIEPFIMEDCIIPKTPLEMMKDSWSNQIPMMIGGNSFEGLLLWVEVKKHPEMLTDLDCRDVVPLELKLEKSSDKCNQLAQKIKEAHFGNLSPSKETKFQYLDLFSYKYWWHPIHRTVLSRVANATAPTYLYRFDFDSKKFNQFRRLACGRKVRGVCHADDLSYLFYNAMSKKLKESKREYKAIDHMVTLWTKFALDSDPNTAEHDVDWKPATAANESQKCLNISDDLLFIDLPEMTTIKIWDSLFEGHNLI